MQCLGCIARTYKEYRNCNICQGSRARAGRAGQNTKSCLNWLFVQALFNCRVYGGSPEQHAIETNLTKAGLSDNLSKFLWAIKVAHPDVKDR